MTEKKKKSGKHIGIKNMGLLSGLEKNADEGKLDSQLPFIGDSRAQGPKPLPAAQKPVTTLPARTVATPDAGTTGAAELATVSAKRQFSYYLRLDTMTKFDDYVWRTRGNKSKIIENLVEEFLQKAEAGETKEVKKKAK